MSGKDVVLTVSLNHDGVEISLSARVVARDFRLTPEPGRGSTQQLCDISMLAAQAVAQPLAAQVVQAYSQFEAALNLASGQDHLAWLQGAPGSVS